MFKDAENNKFNLAFWVTVFSVIMITLSIKLVIEMDMGPMLLAKLKPSEVKSEFLMTKWVFGVPAFIQLVLHLMFIIAVRMEKITLYDRNIFIKAFLGIMLSMTLSIITGLGIIYLALHWSTGWMIVIGIIYLALCIVTSMNDDSDEVEYSFLFVAYSVFAYLHSYGKYKKRVVEFSNHVEEYLKIAKI